ncbi:CaiB/BaiF CoA transferase family protein [Sphingorhabdus sp. 109]|uniref:CaiB/BaiF CoA transferase family protein n=1 Tax=Sphingorhabdus sp. 109 TaxID=2653173 RepID=UPI001916C560|nr:CaiB/BaiF CoA-transferase family protein [Sphingorhabdus sp. 109]
MSDQKHQYQVVMRYRYAKGRPAGFFGERIMQPLEGITILAFEHAIAAPFASRQLAELGARVIKVERPEIGDFARGYDTRVDGLASHFVWTNRSKESLALNIKHPEADNILHRLLEKSDVLLQNLAPGAAARLGLSFESLHAQYPQLIVCDISGYGNDGPDKMRKAYDLLIQSESGFLSITGTEGETAKAGISIADIAAGMYAYTNILTAIIQRGKTGRGSHIDISMLEAMAEWMSYPMYYAYQGAPPPPRAGSSHATIFPYGAFPARDSKSVFIGLQNEREWAVFCEEILSRKDLLEDSRFKGNSLRLEHKDDLTEIIVEVFSGIDSDDLINMLDEAGIANARMNDMAGLWEHAQLKARDRWREVSTSAGLIPALRPPGGLDGMEPDMGAVPDVGEHSQTILLELGYSASEIDALAEAGAI